ncbi:MAG: hypothetical protein JXR81_07305, partial [Candidatus Goldbacteria bacterium]|nr:hypothetical protein [Candidatus Goldiibacteriota bacterium]
MFNVRYNRFLSSIIIALIIAGLGAIVYAITAGAVVSDTIRVSPVLYEPSSSAKLLDKNTLSIYNPSAESSSLIIFDKEIKLKHIKVYGKASHKITLSYLKSEDTWVKVNNLENINLSNASDSWNVYDVNGDVSAKSFKLETEPVAGTSAGIAEIEFWAQGTRANIKNGTSLFYLADTENAPTYTKKTATSPAEASVVVERVKDKTTVKEAVFTVNNSFNTSDINKAWLVYELKGFAGFISTEKVINGKGVKKSWPMPGTSEWAFQAEPINPDILVNGANEIRFSLPAGAAAGYDIKNLYLMVETDAGVNNVIKVSSDNTTVSNLSDGDNSTAFKPALKSETIEFTLNRPAQAEALLLNITENFAGTLAVFGVNNQVEDLVSATVNAASLTTGWNTIELKNINNYSSYKIKMELAEEGKGAISELMVKSSGVGAARAKGINITYPDNGQYYGRSAYITGYIPVMDNGSGNAQVLVGPVVASLKDGVFGAIVSKEDVGLESQADAMPWSVDVTVLYPDGDKVKTKVYLTAPQGYYVDENGQVVQNGDEDVTYGFGVKGTGKKKFKIKNIEIEMDMEDSDKGTSIQVLELDGNDIAPMDMGMVNVTGKGKKAFRFLPHGTKFKNKIKMRLPYDKKKIPAGKTESDVKTYYYNDKINRWVPVEMEKIDKDTQDSVALTDHFTDFINAVIVVPEHQQVQSFNPNQIKDLKAALPGTGITMIEPPQPNNKGDAVLNFRIDVPPGRQGLQPELVISYNSSGGDGLLGYGWDMPVRAISCDTRFGVPRYTHNRETESYLLEGEQLVPFARNKQFAERIYGETSKRFFARVEGKFQRIERIVQDASTNSPNSYYWEVLDKNGTKNTYGYTSNSRLSSDNGNTFMWALTETEDKNGNKIEYFYNSTYLAEKELLPDYILYNGIYKIQFVYGEKVNRKTDGRAGFLRNYIRKLTEIKIINDKDSADKTVKKYVFTYANGVLYKEHLAGIEQYGSDNNKITDQGHTFEYYNDIYDGSDSKLFRGTNTAWTAGISNTETIDILGLDIPDGPSAISSNISKSGGENYNVEGGLEPYFRINVNWGYTNGSGHTAYNLMDMDGDGLPDQVIKGSGDDGDFYWKPNLYKTEGDFASETREMKSFNLDEIGVLNPIKLITNENSKAKMIGGGISVVEGLAGASVNKTNVEIQQDKYIMDVNADRIPDLIDEGRVVFGFRDVQNNRLLYNKQSKYTEVEMGLGDGVDLEYLKMLAREKYKSDLRDSPLAATVMKWEAPYSGTISINAPVGLLQEDIAAITITGYTFADGVRVTIQQNSGSGTALTAQQLWVCRIEEDDGNLHDPNVAEVETPKLPDNIHVNAGDRIFFRVQSVYDGKFDRVTWSPVISYTDVDNTDMTSWQDSNYMSQTVYNSGSDFTLAGSRMISTFMPYKGTVRLAGSLSKTAATSDNAELKIIRVNNGIEYHINHHGNEYNDRSQVFGFDEAGAEIKMGNQGPENGLYYRDIQVEKNDELIVYADVDSNIDISALTCNALMYYTQIESSEGEDVPDALDGDGEYTIAIKVPFDTYFYSRNKGGVINSEYEIQQSILDLPVEMIVPDSASNSSYVYDIHHPVYADDYKDLHLKLKGNIQKEATTSDIRIFLKVTNMDDETFETEMAHLPADLSGDCFASYDNTMIIDEDMWPIKHLRIRMETADENDMKKVRWNPELTFIVKDISGLIVTEKTAVETYMPYECLLLNETDPAKQLVIRNLHANPRFRKIDGCDPIEFVFTVKSYNELLAKAKISVGCPNYMNFTQMYLALGDILPGQKVFMECFSKEPNAFSKVTYNNLYYNDFYYSQPDNSFYQDYVANPYKYTLHPEFGYNNSNLIHIPGVAPSYLPKNPYFEDIPMDHFAAAYRGWSYAAVREIPDVIVNDGFPGSAVPPLPAMTVDEVLELDEYLDFFHSPESLLDETKLTLAYLNNVAQGTVINEMDQIMFSPIPVDQGNIFDYSDMWRATNDVFKSTSQAGSSRMADKYVKKLSPAEILAMTGGDGVPAVSRNSKSEQWGGGVSVGLQDLGLQVSGFGSSGDSLCISDFIDMNGDGFPDFVSDQIGVQYTYPDGGLSNYKVDFDFDGSSGSFTKSSVLNFGVGSAFDPPLATPSGGGEFNNGAQSPPSNGKSGVSMSGSLSGSMSGASSETKGSLIDMNGDGLPDRVRLSEDKKSLVIKFNKGYSFMDNEVSWNLSDDKELAINSSLTLSGGGSLGVSGAGTVAIDAGMVRVGASGGVSGGIAFSRVYKTLTDINGDGLPDLIVDDGNPITTKSYVRFNNGHGFGAERDINLDESFADSHSVSAGTSAGFTVRIRIPIIIATISIGGGYSKYSNQTLNKQQNMLLDMNGDGFPDKVSTFPLTGQLLVDYSNIGRTNLLKAVNRPMSARIEIDYEREGNTYDQPSSKWNMSKLTVKDGVLSDAPTAGDDREETFEYENGKYDKLEREFIGYSTMKQTIKLNQDRYRLIQSDYVLPDNADRFLLKGLLKEQKVYNFVSGSPQLHYKVMKDYSTTTAVHTGTNGSGTSYFPKLQSENEYFYEGTAGPLEKSKSYSYDYCGNVTSYIEEGSEDGDSVRADIVYNIGTANFASFDLSAQPKAINLPVSIEIKDSGNTLLRKRVADYDTNGNVTGVKQCLSGSCSAGSLASDEEATALTYDSYGNISTIEMPENAQGQRSKLQYSYDTAAHAFVTGIEDINLEYESLAAYNYDFGVPASVTDMNGNTISYGYDQHGRILNIKGPNETQEGEYAVQYEYYPNSNTTNAITAYAKTKNRDMANSGTTIDTLTFTDGLNRVIQVKKDADVASGVGSYQSGMIVSGRVLFDNAGRVTHQYYPRFETSNFTVFDYVLPSETPTTFVNDDFDRPVTITNPDQTTAGFAYGIETSRLKTSVVDANGNTKITYKDADGQILKIEEYGTQIVNGQSSNKTLVTLYTYDDIGQIKSVTDDNGNVTNVEYDMMGRRTAIDNPDTGEVVTNYDAASNIISKITPNLASATQAITYTYNYNQLISVVYPVNTENNVVYEYGDAETDKGNLAGNKAGRVKKITHGAGSREMSYDVLGNVSLTIDTVARPVTPAASDTYTVSYTWDNLGRMLNMTYPDNEVLNYGYDAGGLIKSAVTAGQSPVTYVDSILYDRFGKRKYVESGNGFVSQYTYNDANQRLVLLETKNGSGTEDVQSLTYVYDAVGNILGITNTMSMVMNDSAGNSTQSVARTFAYDGFYRLASSSGTLLDTTGTPDTTLAEYSVVTEYDDIHNITKKNQTVAHGGVNVPGLTYGLEYGYNSLTNSDNTLKPHAPSVITFTAVPRAYSYDFNGNCTGLTMTTQVRTMQWDEENRLASFTETLDGTNYKTEEYEYNDAGERVTKKHMEGTETTITEYPNRYTGVAIDGTSGEATVITKNIYLGPQMLASVLTSGTGNNDTFTYTYFYHTDHLGSNTYLTDNTGAIQEHVEYTPWGESWWEPQSVNLELPGYKFTGKEQDLTGLYYYGARYYDPQVSLWQSVDPILDRYLPVLGNEKNNLPGMGGVFRTTNLNLYIYGGLSPMTVIDPDGREITISEQRNNKGITTVNIHFTAKLDAEKSLNFDKNDKKSAAKRAEKTIENTFSYDSKYYKVKVDAEISVGTVKSGGKEHQITLLDSNNYDFNIGKDGEQGKIMGFVDKIGGMKINLNVNDMSGNDFELTLGHEFGHSLGLKHEANGLMKQGGNETRLENYYKLR